MKRVAAGAFAARLTVVELDAVDIDARRARAVSAALAAVARESASHAGLAVHLLTRPRALP